MTIPLTLRQQKGSPLEWSEVDNNFTALRNGIESVIANNTGLFVKVDRNSVAFTKTAARQKSSGSSPPRSTATVRSCSSFRRALA